METLKPEVICALHVYFSDAGLPEIKLHENNRALHNVYSKILNIKFSFM